MKRIKIFTSLLLTFSVISIMSAQELHWAGKMGGSGFDTGYGIAVDGDGNVITVGSFQGTADFDPGSGIANLSSAGSDDIFIAKTDAAGNFLWAKRFGGSSFDIGFDVAVNEEGEIYTTGYFSENVDFDPGAGTSMLNSSGLYDCFVSKLDADGNFIWAKQLGGAQFEIGRAISVDNDGNVILCGQFNGTADFDPGAGALSMTPIGAYDSFVAKLDSDGTLLWASQLGGSVDDNALDLVTDAAGSIFLTGYFWGVADFDPGAGVANFTSAGNFDCFIVKLNSDGSYNWAQTIGGAGEDQGQGITLDSNGNVITTGYFSGTADLDPGAGVFNLISGGGKDAYLSKLDATGALVWGIKFGGFSNDIGMSVQVDDQDNIYSCGAFESFADFDPGAGEAFLLSAGDQDCYQSILASDGSYIWSSQIGGGTDDRGTRMIVDQFNSVHTTGFFQLSADFDPGVGESNLTAVSNYDVFVQKLRQCESSTGNIVASACNEYVSPSGNYVWTTSETYMDTILNAAGCDSVLTIELTVNQVDLTVTTTSEGFLAEQSGASYQWIDCDGDPVAGATMQTFLPQTSGAYAVIITSGTCTLTSDCSTWVVGINDLDISGQVQLRYDAGTNQAIIDLGEVYGNASVELYSVTSQLISSQLFNKASVLTVNMPETAGIYLIRLEADGQFAVLRIMAK